MEKPSKKLVWLGDSREVVRDFPERARLATGNNLRQIQRGLEPVDWKPMETVGPGVKEIRIRLESSYRVFYVAKFAEAVYVIHAFVKKTTKTEKKDLDLGASRYKALVKERNLK